MLYAHADGLLAAQADEGPMDTDNTNIVVNQVFSEWTGESTARMTRTVSEAARIIGTTPRGVRLLIVSGELDEIRIGHRQLIPLTSIHRLLKIVP